MDVTSVGLPSTCQAKFIVHAKTNKTVYELCEAEPSISTEDRAESLLYWNQGPMAFASSSEITGQTPGRLFPLVASAVSLFAFWMSYEIRDLVGSLCWIFKCFSLL